MDSLDLYPNFINHEILTEDQVMSCDINRLSLIGVKVGRGDRFVKKVEQRRKALLTQGLEKLNSLDLCDTFLENNIGADRLLLLDNEDLKKIGVSFFRRRQFLEATKKQIKHLPAGKS